MCIRKILCSKELEKPRKKALLLIGNGYDRALKYKTSYKDFYESSELKKEASNGNTLCNEIINNTNWSLWSDLENGLYKYSKALTEKEKTNPNFKVEFEKLRECLFNYLDGEMRNHSIQDGNEYINNLNSLTEEWGKFDLQTLSFNYTSFVSIFTQNLAINRDNKTIYNPNHSIDSKYLIYQHGMLSNPNGGSFSPQGIVLGIDDSQEVDNSHRFLYKSNQNINNKNQDFQKLVDEKDVYIVFGCSMGDSDRFYFEKLFNNKTNKSFIIYGFRTQEMTKIRQKIEDLTGGKDFFSKNKVWFIDSSQMDIAIINTKSIVSSIIEL